MGRTSFDLMKGECYRRLVSSTRCKKEDPVPRHQRRWIQPASLLISLLCVISVASPLLVVDADTGEGLQSENTTIKRSYRSDHASSFATIPQKAYDLLTQLEERGGVPLPGYVGGRDFQNRERRLPRGRYREYDVNPKIRGRERDAERIVIEQRTGKAYYTGDHYRTFVPLN